MEGVWIAVIGVLGVVVGSLLQHFFESARWKRERRAELQNQRADIYRRFIRECHISAHQIARISEGVPLSGDMDIEEAIAHSDRIVTPTFRELEIVGSRRARDQARSVLKALRVFRQNVAPDLSWGDPIEQRYADKPNYGSPEYMEVYGEYTVARDAFIDAANEELTQ